VIRVNLVRDRSLAHATVAARRDRDVRFIMAKIDEAGAYMNRLRAENAALRRHLASSQASLRNVLQHVPTDRLKDIELLVDDD
jgi:hypothetical protein